MNYPEPEPLIFEHSRPGRVAVPLPESDAGAPGLDECIPASMLREEPADLPEVGQLDLVRHFVRLSQMNMSVDTHFYPLGSCTMKYNPKVNDWASELPGMARIHPYQPDETLQGALALLHSLENALAAVSGFDAISLQPAAGAHGEFLGLLLFVPTTNITSRTVNAWRFSSLILRTARTRQVQRCVASNRYR